ncbi:DNA-directed RNA polymerase subunit delta [Candidatus Phytoplasma meliae]|uniref:RNAP delta factor n=1 Tax=Candidatus Phytoplasma meliae TaxID=1848402 RepID=A0ABS5CXK6_9MOLU|nr:DNA-directed RNA polymerase subunit delta [Candidatus Phytoplasma meliae]MBP5835706.1 DNA-directed RNA polymerase subunit delta [Candidatus Phytoplasma meliae]
MKITKTPKSLLETAYEIMQKQHKPIAIYDLLKQTCKKHKIKDFKDAQTINQLYLDITLSGQFVFCDDHSLLIKENNKAYWDKDFFEKPYVEQLESTPDEITVKNLDFVDFMVDKSEIDKTDSNTQDESENNLLENEQDNSKESKKNTDETSDDKDDNYDDSFDDYEYLYDK